MREAVEEGDEEGEEEGDEGGVEELELLLRDMEGSTTTTSSATLLLHSSSCWGSRVTSFPVTARGQKQMG